MKPLSPRRREWLQGDKHDTFQDTLQRLTFYKRGRYVYASCWDCNRQGVTLFAHLETLEQEEAGLDIAAKRVEHDEGCALLKAAELARLRNHETA